MDYKLNVTATTAQRYLSPLTLILIVADQQCIFFDLIPRCFTQVGQIKCKNQHFRRSLQTSRGGTQICILVKAASWWSSSMSIVTKKDFKHDNEHCINSFTQTIFIHIQTRIKYFFIHILLRIPTQQVLGKDNRKKSFRMSIDGEKKGNFV